MKSKTKNLTLFFCVIVFISCVSQRVEIDQPEAEKTLVLQAFLIPNNTVYASYPGNVVAEITELRSLNETYNQDTIKDALVTMTDENGQMYTLGYNTLYNDYRADVVPDSNSTYTLRVSYDSFPPIKAQEQLPVKIKLDSAHIEPLVRVNSLGDAIGQATIYFKDLRGVENFYEIQITKDNNSKSGLNIYSDDPVITNEFYYPENIELQAYEPKQLLFTDQSLGDKQQAISFSFYPGSSDHSSKNESYHLISKGNFTIKFRSVSKNYYDYYTSFLDYMFNLSGDVLFGSRETVNILGNVENGYGVFGAYQEVYFEKYFEEIKY